MTVAEKSASVVDRVEGALHEPSRHDRIDSAFRRIAQLALLLPLLLLVVLFADVLFDGASRLSVDFLKGHASRRAEWAGVFPALMGTFWLMSLTALITIPLGIGAAIYLEEYAPKNRVTDLLELNIANLAGVPSIIYGLLGLELFVRIMGAGRSLLAGALTLSLLLLPVVVISSREALRTVPMSLREGSYAMGAEKWATIWHVVLPICMPGMLTGIILALARAIGETAPLIAIGALTFIAFAPDGPNSEFTALPIQIFNWISRPQAAFHVNAAAAIVVLLAMMLLLNGLAIYLRNRLQKRIQW